MKSVSFLFAEPGYGKFSGTLITMPPMERVPLTDTEDIHNRILKYLLIKED